MSDTEEQKTKVCNDCEEEKDVGEFSKDNRASDKLQSICKACQCLYQQRAWPSAMVQNSRANDKKYGRVSDPGVEYITEGRIKDLLIIQSGKCFYCAYMMVYGEGVNRKTHPDAVTLEREENGMPHEADNCILACMTCNRNRGSTITFQEMCYVGPMLKAGRIKRCSGDCKQFLDPKSFEHCKGTQDGLSNKCRACVRAASRRAYQRKVNRRRELGL
jgi:5-methylcytosine-specific restriction endonuclease McrA